MKLSRLLVLAVATLVPSLALANGYKGGGAGGYQRPAMALKAQLGHKVTARTIGKLADGSTVIAAHGEKGDQVFVLNAAGKLSDAKGAAAAFHGITPLATVKIGDGTGRGLATLTDHGMRASVNGQNVLLTVRGGKLTTRRDGVTARPATQRQLEQSAYAIYERTGNTNSDANWSAAVAQSRDGR